jgi:2-polyprenyl-6-methoxyphenol hydroxylase-like FAD-dependent oxidoreductase
MPHPYRRGVALVGDAAAVSDPSWGQGLSMTLRDVRVLRDQLLASEVRRLMRMQKNMPDIAAPCIVLWVGTPNFS